MNFINFKRNFNICYLYSAEGDLSTQIRWMTEYAEDLGTGKILGWYRGPRPAIYVTDPEFIKEVFIKESETFIDRPMLDRSDTIPHLINLKGMFLRAIKSLNIHTLDRINGVAQIFSQLYLLIISLKTIADISDSENIVYKISYISAALAQC